MHTVPEDVFEPSMAFDILRVIRVDVSSGIVASASCRKILSLVTAGAETLTLLLDYSTHEVLAAGGNGRLGGEREGRTVVENVEFCLGAATFFG